MEQLGASASDVPDEPLDAVPEILARRPQAPRPEPKRNRDWEARQQAAGHVVVAFRNVPTELRDDIKTIAQKHGVRTGEVARFFLEHSLAAFQAGRLSLPRPKLEKGRLTLYPENDD